MDGRVQGLLPNGNPKMPRGVPEPDKDWEDKFRREQQLHNETKLKTNAMERELRMLQTWKHKLENNGEATSAPYVTRNKEAEDMIASLMEKNSQLSKLNINLTEKNRLIVDQLDRKKAEVSALKRAAEGAALAAKENHPPLPAPPSADMKAAKATVETPAAKTPAKRGATPDSELAQLREENARLRRDTGSSTFKGTTRGTGDIESQLQEANRKLQTMQATYDLLDSKAKSQQLATKQAESRVEAQNEKVQELRKMLEELRREKEQTETKALRADELDDLVKELKRDNRSLEEKIAGLSKDPFIEGAFHQQEMREALEAAVRERDELKKKFGMLQESVQAHYTSLSALKQKTEELAREKGEAEKIAEEMRERYKQLDERAVGMQDQVGVDGCGWSALANSS